MTGAATFHDERQKRGGVRCGAASGGIVIMKAGDHVVFMYQGRERSGEVTLVRRKGDRESVLVVFRNDAGHKVNVSVPVSMLR